MVLDGTASSSAHPNRGRTFSPGLGTLTIRRRFVNNTGGVVTRLRFRVVELTSHPAPPGTADLRVLTSTGVENISPISDATTCLASTGSASTPCALTVEPTALETPPAQTNGGGVNSTMTVDLGAGLPAGASVNVRFVLGIQQIGTFRFLVIAEALP